MFFSMTVRRLTNLFRMSSNRPLTPDRSMSSVVTAPAPPASMPGILHNKSPTFRWSPGTQAADPEHCFNFTRGRFVVNEQHEIRQHQVRFDVQRLARVAAEAVGSACCVDITKYADGMFNKAFLLTMNDGTQAVAKIPNPNAGRPHVTIASEVATMDFVRNYLATPVPKVYAWSGEAQDNNVGAEYIVMEKVSGVQLADFWNDMRLTDRAAVVKTIAGYQNSWMSASFSHFGSIYYTDDSHRLVSTPFAFTDSNGQTVSGGRFIIGPSTSRSTNDCGRSAVDFDRGPWHTLDQWVAAIGKREVECLRSMREMPKSPITLCGPGTYRQDRDKKLKALNCYLKMVPYLLPTDPTIQSSCLWHSDLHGENIFVNPNKPAEVVGIIDWQSVSLEPLFTRNQQPYFLDHEGTPTKGLECPPYPENLDQMDHRVSRKARALYFDQVAAVYYRCLVSRQMRRLHRAFEFQETPSFDLLSSAWSLLIDGEALYMAQVRDMEPRWAELPGVQTRGTPPFPLQFSEEERAGIEASLESSMEGMLAMKRVKVALGKWWPERGLISHELVEDSITALREAKKQVIAHHATNEDEQREWEACWPFDR